MSLKAQLSFHIPVFFIIIPQTKFQSLWAPRKTEGLPFMKPANLASALPQVIFISAMMPGQGTQCLSTSFIILDCAFHRYARAKRWALNSLSAVLKMRSQSVWTVSGSLKSIAESQWATAIWDDRSIDRSESVFHRCRTSLEAHENSSSQQEELRISVILRESLCFWGCAYVPLTSATVHWAGRSVLLFLFFILFGPKTVKLKVKVPWLMKLMHKKNAPPPPSWCF